MPGTRTEFCDVDCGFAQAVEALGDQWSMLILRNLFMGMTRFDDFVEHLSISTKVLTNRLERLAEKGLITSMPDPHDRRGKIYQLTEKGRGLGPVVGAMTMWGETWEPKQGGPRTEFFNTETGEPIESVRLVDRKGTLIEPGQIGSRTGPGGSTVRDHLDALVAHREQQRTQRQG